MHRPEHRGPLDPDNHVVEPESGQEMIDGRVVRVSPALPAHADRQFGVAFVLGGHVAEGYIGATELLTRVSEGNDFATDLCIRKDGEDAHGNRHVEEISFEIKHTQSEASLAKRARELVRRGVRRVFAIDVNLSDSITGADSGDRPDDRRSSAVQASLFREWSAAVDDWVARDPDGYIEDPCLRAPVKVRAFLDGVEGNNAVARALVAQRNPVIVEVQAQSYDQGRSDGLREGIRALCTGFGIELHDQRVARLETSDVAQLRELLEHVRAHRAWPCE